MEKKIKFAALIGAGAMAEYHIRGFREAGAEVSAIVDQNPEHGAEFARKWGFPGESYLSLKELLTARPEIQAVSVITPNKYHKPLVLEALSHGLHVFCEKPPALNAAEVCEMAELANEKKRMLMFNLNNRARLDSQFIKKEIGRGKIGRINSAQATWMRRTGIPGFGGWFTTKAIAGGGPLIDLLHMIDLALWFMDFPEPDTVLAQTFQDFISDPNFHGSWGKVVSTQGTTDVESACHAFVRFKTGQVLTIHTRGRNWSRRKTPMSHSRRRIRGSASARSTTRTAANSILRKTGSPQTAVTAFSTIMIWDAPGRRKISSALSTEKRNRSQLRNRRSH